MGEGNETNQMTTRGAENMLAPSGSGIAQLQNIDDLGAAGAGDDKSDDDEY